MTMTTPLTDKVRGKDYLLTQDWTNDEIELLLDTAVTLKRQFKAGEPHLHLLHKTLFMMFFDKSTRTRNSMEAGMTQLGGHAHFVDAATSQIAHGESPKDTGIILSSYGHGMAIRHDLVPGEGQTYMREVAKHADRPVINLQCDVDHPCQSLADLMTIREQFGTNLQGRTIAVSWAYAPSYAKPVSVPQALITLMTRFGLNVRLAMPPEFPVMPDQLKIAQQNAAAHGTSIELVDDMDAAFEGAHIVYPKSWGALDLFGNPEESLKIAKNYSDWICDERRMGLAAEDAIYMHCLPADRGNEVTDAVIDGPQSVVYREAENRMHTGKAIMALTM